MLKRDKWCKNKAYKDNNEKILKRIYVIIIACTGLWPARISQVYISKKSGSAPPFAYISRDIEITGRC